MYERPHVNEKIERGSSLTYTRDLLYIVSTFIYARKIYVRSHGKITRQWKSTLIQMELFFRTSARTRATRAIRK